MYTYISKCANLRRETGETRIEVYLKCIAVKTLGCVKQGSAYSMHDLIEENLTDASMAAFTAIRLSI